MPQVTMPQLGEGVEEGTIGKWLKAVGDKVRVGDPLVEVVTDKVNAEVPSPFEGTLTSILVNEGDTVGNDAPIAEIDEAGAGASAPQTEAAADLRGGRGAGAEEPAPKSRAGRRRRAGPGRRARPGGPARPKSRPPQGAGREESSAPPERARGGAGYRPGGGPGTARGAAGRCPRPGGDPRRCPHDPCGPASRP